jgi:hypothetical protein
MVFLLHLQQKNLLSFVFLVRRYLSFFLLQRFHPLLGLFLVQSAVACPDLLPLQVDLLALQNLYESNWGQLY